MKKWLLRTVSLLCMVCLVFCLAPNVVAASRDLKDIQADIDAKKETLNALEDTINANKNNKAAAQQALNQYQQEFDALVLLIEEKEDSIARREAEVDFKVEQISNTIEAVQSGRELFEERLRAIYDMNSTNAMMSTLLTVNSFSEAVMAADAIRRVSERDTAMLDDLQANLELYEQQKAELEDTIVVMNEELAGLQADKEWAAGKISQMQGQINLANANIQQSQAETEATEAEIAELQAEYERVFKELQAKSSKAGDGSVRYDGPLGWPVQGYSRVSSWFGDGRSNTGSHYGIDIPAPVGTNILASAPGLVVTSEWHYSYGYYIVIDHGQGLRTLYAHNSQLYVAAGTQVEKGQAIAACGNTGNSYGAHCHFEVHEHGGRQNPAGANYLNIH